MDTEETPGSLLHSPDEDARKQAARRQCHPGRQHARIEREGDCAQAARLRKALAKQRAHRTHRDGGRVDGDRLAIDDQRIGRADAHTAIRIGHFNRNGEAAQLRRCARKQACR